MTDDENKERSDLFGDSSAAKPLFGADESLPQGKPLFNNELDGPGDAAYVKPLFSDSDDEHNTLDDFQEFDNVPDTEDSADAAPAENPAPAESDSAADDAQGYAAEKNNLFSDDPSNRPFAEDLIPADTNPPAGNNGFVQESPEPSPESVMHIRRNSVLAPLKSVARTMTPAANKANTKMNNSNRKR